MIENEEIQAQTEDEVEVTEPETVDASAEDDLEAVEEPETNPISELIGSIENKDFVSASNAFNSILGDRVQAALDNEKIAVADRIYNPEAPADAEQVEAQPETDGEEVVAA